MVRYKNRTKKIQRKTFFKTFRKLGELLLKRSLDSFLWTPFSGPIAAIATPQHLDVPRG